MPIEFISSEHDSIWRILERSKYSQKEADDLEAMYKFLLALKEVVGTRAMEALAVYSEVYSKELSKAINYTSKEV